MKKLRTGGWGISIRSGDTSVRSLLSLIDKTTTIPEQHKIKPGLHRTFHPTKGFGYRSRRGKRNNGTVKYRS